MNAIICDKFITKFLKRRYSQYALVALVRKSRISTCIYGKKKQLEKESESDDQKQNRSAKKEAVSNAKTHFRGY